MAATRVEKHLRANGGRLVTGGRGALLAALALLFVACIGFGSGRSLWRIGGPPELVSPRSYAGDLVIIGFGILVVAPLIVSAIRRRTRPKRVIDEPESDLPPVRIPWWGRVLALLAVAGSVLVALLVLSLLPGSGSESTQGVPRPPPDGSGTSPPASPDGALPPVHWWGLTVLVLVMLAALVTVWRLRDARSKPEVEPEPEGTDELLAAVDLSLEEIEREPDPRRAVIRAYARMEGALGLHGLARRPFETPLEYLARALTSLRVGRPSVERLTALFERAKFSQHEIDASMKMDALSALAALRDELGDAAA